MASGSCISLGTNRRPRDCKCACTVSVCYHRSLPQALSRRSGISLGSQRKPGCHRSEEKDRRKGKRPPGHRSASPVGTLCRLGTLEGGLLKPECAGSHFGDLVQMQMLVQTGWDEPEVLHSDRLPGTPVVLVLGQRRERQVIEHFGEPCVSQGRTRERGEREGERERARTRSTFSYKYIEREGKKQHMFFLHVSLLFPAPKGSVTAASLRDVWTDGIPYPRKHYQLLPVQAVAGALTRPSSWHQAGPVPVFLLLLT